MLRFGMVGGGPGSFIGEVHLMAAGLDGQTQLVAGAFSSDPAKSKTRGHELGLDPNRIYGTYQEMAQAEAAREDGIDFVVMIIGLFAISEILLMLEHANRKDVDDEMPPLGRVFVSLKEVLYCKGAMWRSGILGFIIGVLPGTGASVAGAVAYTTEKRLSDKNGTFGHGDMRGLAAPESANNASAAGSFVPMLTLGIPGSGTTAVLLGALMLYNITPGPMMFTERPEVAGGLIASLYIGNIVLLALNLPLAGVFARVLTIPRWVLVPAIAILAFVGVYQLHSDLTAIYLMLIIGVFGYLLRKLGFSLAPVILGYVLGGLMEQNLRRALSISGGDIDILWQSGISLGLWIAAAALLVLPWLVPKLLSKKPREETQQD